MKPRILVAEDNLEIRTLFVELLTDQGWDVEAVENGEDALHALLHYEFEAVSTDFDMPGANGLEVTKAALALKNPPKVFMFSGTDSAREPFLELGGVIFMDKTKPTEYLGILKLLLKKEQEKFCDCSDCEEEACQMDCNQDDLCRGCRDAQEDEKDREFEFAKSQGRI